MPLAIFLLLVTVVLSQSSCQSEHRALSSTCTGCPPRDRETGKLCASTTRYNDLTKGACGCGSEPNPPSYWSKKDCTAALNCKNLDPKNPLLSWCPANCGGCFRLCSTGGTTSGKPTTRGKCIVVRVENRCGDGFNQPGEAQWCRQQLSYQECLNDPNKCSQKGNTNDYGYSAHFDLQDASLQVSRDLGWDNVEVTFEPVDCSLGPFPDWKSNCFCPLGSPAASLPPTPRPTPKPVPKTPPVAPRPVAASVPKNPPPVAKPVASNTGASCSNVFYGSDPSNQWYTAIVGPKAPTIVALKCGDGKIYSCGATGWDGRFECRPTAPCPLQRTALVNGISCPLSTNTVHQRLSEEPPTDPTTTNTTSPSEPPSPAWVWILVACACIFVIFVVILTFILLRPSNPKNESF